MTQTTVSKSPRRIEYMVIDELPEALVNPKGHDVEGIAASIRLHGFTEPPLIDERTKRLVGGHGRRETLIAMREAGEAPPDGITVDSRKRWRAPVIRGWSSANDAAAEAMLVALNRLPEAGGWDEAELLAMLDRIDAAGLDVAVTGFDEDDVADLRAAIDEALAPPPDGRSAIDPKTGSAANEPSLQDRLGEYAAKGIRSVIMDLDLAAFGWFSDHAPTVRDALGVTTNVDMLLHLMAAQLGIEAPALAVDELADAGL